MARIKVSGAGIAESDEAQSMFRGGTRDPIFQALLDSIAVTLCLLNVAGSNGSILLKVPIGRQRPYAPP